MEDLWRERNTLSDRSGWTAMIVLSLMIFTVKPNAREDLVTLELASLADFANILSSLVWLNDLREALVIFLFFMSSTTIKIYRYFMNFK